MLSESNHNFGLSRAYSFDFLPSSVRENVLEKACNHVHAFCLNVRRLRVFFVVDEVLSLHDALAEP